METIDTRQLLWNDLSRLGGVVRPRTWHWVTDGPGRRADNVAVLGEDWLFAEPSFADTLLDRLASWLALDRTVWKVQRDFLKGFVCTFFGPTDRPAWIKVHAMRTGFQRRSGAANGNARHVGQRGRGMLTLSELPWSGIRLDGKKLLTHGVRLFHPSGAPEQELELRRVYVHRVLRADALGGTLAELEERLVVVSDDIHERRLAAGGFTPALAPFHDEVAGTYTSPLVSLCRIDDRGRISNRCFSLRPEVGDIADLRASAYVPEYYFRSDMTCHTMLERLITPGEYGTF